MVPRLLFFGRCYQTGTAELFQRQGGASGRKFKKNVPCHGKGYQSNSDQACGRLHNMRTLQYMRPEKQQEKARETMDIYAPIAMRLGISKIKVELDDLSLKYLKPDVYYDLVDKVSLKKSERQDFVNGIVKQVNSIWMMRGSKLLR